MSTRTAEQDRAIDAVARWYNNGQARKPVFKLFGYAGTGKTTLAKHFAEGVKGDVMFGAFTGKAASVLRAKKCENASTIHQMIYRPTTKSRKRLDALTNDLELLYKEIGPPEEGKREARRAPRKLINEIEREREELGQPGFVLKEFIGPEGYDETTHERTPMMDPQLLILDECSMIAERMAADLMSFGVPILVLGDPAQLPPVKGNAAFTNSDPDFMLTEIHRQAEGDPIIQLATLVREGKRLTQGEYGRSRVCHKGEITKELALAHDQIIVGRNLTRHRLNRLWRVWKGVDKKDPPHVGERLVCLKNDHNLGLLNGTLWEVTKVSLTGIDPWDPDARLLLDLKESGPLQPVNLADVIAYSDCFYDAGAKRDWKSVGGAQQFDYGYALTAHKAQGSQWDKVLIRDESRCFREDANKWLYTAITRASDAVTIAVD